MQSWSKIQEKSPYRQIKNVHAERSEASRFPIARHAELVSASYFQLPENLYKPQVCNKNVHGVFWDKIRAHVALCTVSLRQRNGTKTKTKVGRVKNIYYK